MKKYTMAAIVSIEDAGDTPVMLGVVRVGEVAALITAEGLALVEANGAAGGRRAARPTS
jgi:hypothetical protein